MSRGGAAWWFVAPALFVIGVFFFVPVLAALALSLTDFDIYALADSRNLRVVGLRNYVELLRTPLFWRAFGNTLYFVVVGVPLAIRLRTADVATSFWFCFFPILAFYYPLMAYGVDRAKVGAVPPYMVLLGNAACLAIGAWLLRRVFRY